MKTTSVGDNGETWGKQRRVLCDHGDSQAQGWQTIREDESCQDLEVGTEGTMRQPSLFLSEKR